MTDADQGQEKEKSRELRGRGPGLGPEHHHPEDHVPDPLLEDPGGHHLHQEDMAEDHRPLEEEDHHIPLIADQEGVDHAHDLRRERVRKGVTTGIPWTWMSREKIQMREIKSMKKRKWLNLWVSQISTQQRTNMSQVLQIWREQSW